VPNAGPRLISAAIGSGQIRAEGAGSEDEHGWCKAQFSLFSPQAEEKIVKGVLLCRCGKGEKGDHPRKDGRGGVEERGKRRKRRRNATANVEVGGNGLV